MNYCRAMTGTKRVLADQCCGAIIDYQDYFLAQLEPRSRARLSRNMASFARLLAYMRIPTIVTLSAPLAWIRNVTVRNLPRCAFANTSMRGGSTPGANDAGAIHCLRSK